MTTSVEIEDIKRVAVKPGEILVVRISEDRFDEAASDVLKAFQEALPGVKVIITTDDLELQSISAEQEGILLNGSEQSG